MLLVTAKHIEEQVLVKLFKGMNKDAGINWEIPCIGIHHCSPSFSTDLVNKSVVILKYTVSLVRQELVVVVPVSPSVISLCQKTLYQTSEGDNHVAIFTGVRAL